MEPINVGDQVIGISDGWEKIIGEVERILADSYIVRVTYSPSGDRIDYSYYVRKFMCKRYMP